MNRIKYIDALKGLAIICVALGHVANGYLGEGAKAGTVIYHNVYNFVYAFHMPLFFILSGFLFRKVYISGNEIKSDKIKKQIINLLCLYVIYCLILGVFKMIFGGFVNNKVSVKDLLLIPVKPIQLYWYIYVLAFYYFIFSRKKIVELKKIYVVIATLILLVASYFLPKDFYFDIKRLFYYMLFFFVGILFCDHEEIVDKNVFVGVTSFFTFFIYIAFWKNEKMINEIWFVNALAGISIAFSIIWLVKNSTILGENPVLNLVGRYSLEIYLLHTFFMTALRVLCHKVHLENPVVVLIVITLISVAVPILIAVICKKIKLYNLLFAPAKLFEKKPAA